MDFQKDVVKDGIEDTYTKVSKKSLQISISFVGACTNI